MTNEEHIEEILMEASAINLRNETLELYTQLRETNPKLDRVASIELAFHVAILKAVNRTGVRRLSLRGTVNLLAAALIKSRYEHWFALGFRPLCFYRRIGPSLWFWLLEEFLHFLIKFVFLTHFDGAFLVHLALKLIYLNCHVVVVTFGLSENLALEEDRLLSKVNHTKKDKEQHQSNNAQNTDNQRGECSIVDRVDEPVIRLEG